MKANDVRELIQSLQGVTDRAVGLMVTCRDGDRSRLAKVLLASEEALLHLRCSEALRIPADGSSTGIFIPGTVYQANLQTPVGGHAAKAGAAKKGNKRANRGRLRDLNGVRAVRAR